MNKLPIRVRLYVFTILLTAGVLWHFAPGNIPLIPLAALVLTFAIVEAFPVVREAGQEYVTLSGTIACLASAMYGPKLGMTTAIVGVLLASIWLRAAPIKALFNASQVGIMSIAAVTVFNLIGGNPQLDTISIILPFLAMYLAYWLTNTVLISVLFSLIERKSFWVFLRNEIRGFYLQQGLMMVINCTVLASYHAFGLWAMILLVVVLLLVRYAMAAYDHARSFYIRIIQLLTGVMEAQDRFTHGHSERVAHYAMAVGQSLRLPDAQLDLLRTAALLHDVGKMKIPREVLHKPSRLTDEEFDLVKEHPVIGAEWVGKLDPRGNLAKTIRHHHERWDGKGYPDGISGHDIPDLARIITVVDAFDAMTSDRPYRSSMSPERALAILRENAGTQFDPRVVNAFLAVADEAIRTVPQPSLAMAQAQAAVEDAAAAAAEEEGAARQSDKRERTAISPPGPAGQAAGRV